MMTKKKFLIFFCFSLLLADCAKKQEYDKHLNTADLSQIMDKFQKQEDKKGMEKNILITSQDEVKEKAGLIERTIENNSVDVVDKILMGPTKNIKIAFVVPMSGKLASTGTNIAEAGMLTMSNTIFHNSGKINIYDIGQLDDKWKDNPEVKRLIKDDNDVIIGSIFKDTTKKLLSVLPQDIPFISFANDEELIKDYPNLSVVSLNEGFKIIALLQYLQDQKRQFLSLVLPATKKGYAEEKIFRALAPDYQVFIVNTQFYQEHSKPSMSASIRGLNRAFTATYMIDDNGQFYTETYKQNKEKKRQNKNLEQQSTTIVKTENVETNAIYIGADENDLSSLLSFLERLGVLNRNVQIFSNAVVETGKTHVADLESVLYIGYNYDFIDKFNKKFNDYFGHAPNYFAYMTYDIVSMLLYVANVGNMLPRNFYSEDGFRGTLDEFRFTREGGVERRFGIYKLKNGIMTREFVPDDYVPLWKTTSAGRKKKEIIYK